MNLSSGQKLIAAIVSIVLVAAVVFFLLILPKFSQMSTLDQDISDAEIDIQSAQTLLKQRQQLKAESAATETQLLMLANMLPEHPEMPGLIIELQDTVNASGLEFVLVAPSDPEPLEEGYTAVLSELVVRGKWQDVVDLLQRLRRISRQLRVVDFQVERYVPEDEALDVSDETLVEAIINIEVYMMPRTTDTTGTVPPAPGQ